jgi:hypothetical protein
MEVNEIFLQIIVEFFVHIFNAIKSSLVQKICPCFQKPYKN